MNLAKSITVVFTGGRDFKDVRKFADVFCLLHQDRIKQVFVGDCPTGLDMMVRDNFPSVRIFQADWKTHGRKAGPLRNREMLEAAVRDARGADGVLLIAFPTGGPGTRDCTLQARSMGITAMEVR